jgi:hypothetical protein
MLGSGSRLERERVRKAVACITASITDAAPFRVPPTSLAEVSGAESTSDPDTMNTAPELGSGGLMHGELYIFSHIMLWIVGGIAAVGAVGVIGAFWSMGRQGYRKD